VTYIFFRNFSLYSTSCYFSTSSFLRCFSSRFNAKNTWRFLSSSNFYSVYMIFVISLSLFTSSLFSTTSWSYAIENNIFCWSFKALNSWIDSFIACVRRFLSKLNASFWICLVWKLVRPALFPPLSTLSCSLSNNLDSY
jgi:hypothetical protein